MPVPPPQDDQRCTGTTASGKRCARWAQDGTDTCFHHSPDHLDDPRRCTGTASGGLTRPERKGKQCRSMAMQGQTVCESHGGMAPQNRFRAAVDIAEKKARKLMETYGRPIDVAPTEALLDEVRITAGHVAWLRQRITELEPNELIWGTTRIKDGGHDAGTTQEAEIHAYVKLYQQERKHLVTVCAEAIRCGIEERYVRLVEQQGEMVADAIKAILGDLNLTEAQQVKAKNIVPFRLRQLTA